MSSNNEYAIQVQDVSKIYKLYDKPIDRLKESLSLTHKNYHKDFFALSDISFNVKKGETVGIIGTNGSGKSTILKIITGVLTPTSGQVRVSGVISALLELGAGFNMDYTGIENIYMNGTMMGFSKKQMDLNWDNPVVRQEIADMVNFWLDMGVDGFRCDVINNISKDLSAPGCGYGPHLHEYLHELYERAFQPHGALTVGETWGLTPQQTLALTGEARGELTMSFQFEHLLLGRVGGDKFRRCPVDRTEFVNILAKWEVGLKDDGYPVLVMENHDQPRALSRFGDSAYPYESATMLAVLLYGMRGVPFIYQGQELGLSSPVFRSLSEYRDIETINAYHEMRAEFTEEELLPMMNFGSRDNSRVPMPWSEEANGGFTSGTSWIQCAVDPARTVAAEEKDPRSVLHFYRRLLALRRENDCLRRGEFALLHNEDGTVLYQNTLGARKTLVACRFADSEAALPDGVPENAALLLSNYEDADTTAALRPYEARIFEVC